MKERLPVFGQGAVVGDGDAVGVSADVSEVDADGARGGFGRRIRDPRF